MEYKIVEAAYQEGLIKLVNENIKLGWKPQGGISVVRNLSGSTFNYCQAMIKD